jgi:HTH-type transcriptional regulator, bacterioopsin transcriptional activator and related proteins
MSDDGFYAIFEYSLDPMLVAADDARYIDANPAACEFFGLSRAELCARRVVDFAPPAAKAQFDAVWKLFLRAGQPRGELTRPREARRAGGCGKPYPQTPAGHMVVHG